MALQLQIFVDLRTNISHVHGKSFCGWRMRTPTTRLRFQVADCFPASREPSTRADIRVSLTERGNGMPSCSIAAPGYSSMQRRGRRQEMNVHAGDRFMMIAEWVYRKVKDPLVEIDPVTVDKKIKEEEEQAREEQAREEQVIEQDEPGEETESSIETTATVVPPTFFQPRSGFSRVNLSTEVAGAALIVLAFLLAYLGFRSKSALLSKSKQNSRPFSTSPGPVRTGGKRDAGTARVVHHGLGTKQNSPPQDLHEQFRHTSNAQSSEKAVTLRASAALTSLQAQDIVPADSSPREETYFSLPPVVMPHEQRKLAVMMETEETGSHDEFSLAVFPPDTNLPLAKSLEEIDVVNGVVHDISSAAVVAKPLEEVVALTTVGRDRNSAVVSSSEAAAKPLEEVVPFNAVGLDRNFAVVSSSEAEAKPFEEVVAFKAVGLDRNSAEVSSSEVEAKPFEEVVAFNAVGLDRSSAEVSSSEAEAKPFEEVVVVNGLWQGSTPAKVAGSEANLVEFQNALIFEKPQAAGILWPEEDTRPALETEYPSATSTSEYVGDMKEISEVELPSIDFQNAILSGSPFSPSFLELIPEDEDITKGASSQLVEDPVLFNLDSASPVKDDDPIEEVMNGAAAVGSDVQEDEERRKSYAKAIQAVAPAIVVGVGAVSTISGVSSALEVVGLVAVASFLTREVFMASARQQLLGDLSKIKDRSSFLEFLNNRQIIKDL